MTMHDFLANGLLKDEDAVQVIRPLTFGPLDRRRGHWYNDQILDFHNAEITECAWSQEKGWTFCISPQG